MKKPRPKQTRHMIPSQRGKPCSHFSGFPYTGATPCTGPEVCAMCGTRREDCDHPTVRLHVWHATDGALCIACNACGAVLRGAAPPPPRVHANPSIPSGRESLPRVGFERSIRSIGY